MGKQKSRDMNMYMQTDFYKNILYDNYKQQCEEIFSAENASTKKKRTLAHRRNQSMKANQTVANNNGDSPFKFQDVEDL